MDNKYQAAESLQDILMIILGYEDRKKAAKAGISADLFLGDNGIAYLKDGIKKAILEVKVQPPFKQHLLQLLNDMKDDVPFEETVELWEMVTVLLRYIKKI